MRIKSTNLSSLVVAAAFQGERRNVEQIADALWSTVGVTPRQISKQISKTYSKEELSERLCLFGITLGDNKGDDSRIIRGVLELLKNA